MIRKKQQRKPDSKYSIKKDIPPSEYFTEWEEFTQVINGHTANLAIGTDTEIMYLYLGEPKWVSPTIMIK